MLTSTVAPDETRKAIPSYRPFDVTVARIQQLTDTFVRVTFTGPLLHEFGTAGLDQRVKLVFPLPAVGIASFPEDETWYDVWRSLPDERRNPIRTYTVRAVRPAVQEIDIDFVAHGDTGPASRWVRRAAVGDELTIVGPDAKGENPSIGIEWRPGSARNILIAGDETAVPAVCAILAALPRNAQGCAFLEVPYAGDVMETGAPDGVQVTWLAREPDTGLGGAKPHDSPQLGSNPHGSALEAAVRDWTDRFIRDRHRGADVADVDIENDILWDVPDATATSAPLYAWLAGEANVIKTLRRFLVSETGIDRRQVAFMGYWRNGRSELN
jgi:NADPH-dependent ferric siderophore reductase